MTQTIEQLTARVRELEEEKKQLEDDCGYQMQWKREFREQLEYSQKQLASAQLQIKQLRDALTKIEYLESDNGCILSAGDCSSLATEALATPTSTEALDAYVAEKVKEIQRNASGLADMYVERGERIFTLTRQRDLAVEALENIRHHQEMTPVLTYQGMEQIALNALNAIKESEVK